MCGRFQLSGKGKHISERYSVEVFDDIYNPNYNCAPSQNLPIITNINPTKLSYFKWGLIPFWAKDPKVGFRNINARAETILEKPSFRHSFNKRRCIIPANGFYEWRQDSDKTPYRIFLKTENVFSMAGIWDTWKDAENKEFNTFSILTTVATEKIKIIHNRMPVILRPDIEKEWLSDLPGDKLQAYIKSYDAKKLEFYPVSKRINSPKHNDPDLIIPESVQQSKLF